MPRKPKKVEKKSTAKSTPLAVREVQQVIGTMDTAVIFASSALNALIMKAGEEDSHDDIRALAWEFGNKMAAGRPLEPADAQPPLPLGGPGAQP